MDLLENLYNKIVDRSSILNLVDEYTLYCYYLNAEVEINQVTLSPIRTSKADSLPSFRIFYGRAGKLYWYDHGLGGKGGDVFDLVKILFTLDSFQDAINKINQDFELGWQSKTVNGKRLDTLKPIIRDPADIDAICHDEFTLKGISYWRDYGISREILQEYNVRQVKYVLLDRRFKSADELSFSYRIGKFLKIYQPHSVDHKFINNYPPNYVEGLFQLMQRKDRRTDLLIITKSTKDIMVLRTLGFDAIAPKAENNPIPQFLLDTVEGLYDEVVTLFDPDEAGTRARARYKYRSICHIPEPERGIKDTADYMKIYGADRTRTEIFRLLNSTI